MSQRDFSENEPECTPELPAANRALFLEKVRQSNAACQAGDFNTAVTLYTDALTLDPTNHILFSNRSAARLKQGQFALALQDATKARELCSQWPKAYFRQGVALQCLGRYGEALASFSAGLGQDINNKQLLAGLIEATIKSPLRHALEPTFQQLRMMKLDQSPFVVISVVGQELLQAGQYHAAVTVLEAALRIGSCSLKLRGSVFSALSSAHWALNQLDKAIGYMQQDLAVAKSLGDTAGECRAHGNLGSAYFSQGSFKEALTAHRYQLVLAMKCKDTQAAAAALTSLGHVYTAIGDYPNALASHKQCVQLVKQMGDRLQEAREIGNVGAVYLAMGEFDSAVDCHTQHLRLARKLNHQVEEARAYSNLGSSHHYRRNFAQAIQYHEQVLRIAQQLGDRVIEARAYAGLGHASRCANDFAQAKRWHEKQLEMALAARDKMGEGRACSNLGIVYQLLGEHDAALKLHQAHLTISRLLQDRAGMGRAYGNIGNAYSAAGLYEAAIKYHKQELTISKEVHDRSAEAATHGNLAVAYQALGAHDMALMHYRAHLNIARELKDTAGEACALLNMGNCLSSRQEFGQAVPYYEQYLMLSQELGDVRAEGKACHFLGYAHYCIGNYREAVRYYDQDLALAKDMQDKMNMGRAYCNLGLAHLALGNSASALECQKYFLAIAHMTNHLAGKFRALGNIGDVLVRAGDIEEAAKMYHRQLALARQGRERPMEAAACGALGLAHRLLKKFDKALGYHTQELTLRQELCDLSGECRSHGHLGAVHMALGNYTHAVKCYQEQLERAQELQDSAVEAQAFGNLGIAKLNMGQYEEAIGYLEQQMGTLEQVTLPTAQHDRARALGHLGDCYDALGDFEEAIKCHERHLLLAAGLQSHRDQERAYRGLGHSHRALGNLQEALVCLEKRLVVSHELGSLEAKAAAYGDLGYIHSALGNHEQAVNCLEHQRDIANDLGDRIASSDATSGLGAVFLKMGDLEGALKLHQIDLELCDSIGLHALQARASGNLGLVYEALRNYSESVQYFEKQLSLTADRLVKANACGALGRVFHTMGEITQAINFLRQGLAIAQSLNQSEEEARIRHRLGLVLLASGDKENARTQLEIAAEVLETVRFEQRTPEARSALFDLQTTCYHTLQKTLVAMNHTEEALVAAERCKARNSGPQRVGLSRRSLSCSENIFDIVNRCKQDILYFSLADDELYAWFLQPQKRIVRFNMSKIDETTLVIPKKSVAAAAGALTAANKPGVNAVTAAASTTTAGVEQKETDNTTVINTGGSLLERYINMVRDSLGVNSDNVLQEGDGSAWRSSENLLDDFANERQGFLRMVNRNHLLNSSNYSLSSLFSLGSVGGSVASLQGSTRSIGSLQGSTRSRRVVAVPPWQGPSSLHALYNLLLKPFDDLLPSITTTRVGHKELILVLESELYLVPFAVLRSGQDGGEYLSERCSILTVPSLQTLRQKSRQKTRDPPENLNSALVVGGPRIPSSLAESWGWSDTPASLQEAAMVSDMLQAKALVSTHATKEGVLAELPSAECVHFAANLSWKQGAIVLSPGEMMEPPPAGKKRFLQSASAADADCDTDGVELAGNGSADSSVEMPPMSDFMLSSTDVLALKLSAKLIVLSSYHSLEPISGAGVAVLTGSWLSAGAGAILVSLWPVPETAAKILLRAFYSALLQGTRAARALAEAMQTVQHTKHFAHPANWAGFLLIGGNIRLSNKVALIGQALCELMRSPDKCRDALRVCLHLVEKSLQRIHRGQKNAMYTTQKSIDNKAGSVSGWKDLLMAVGFRFEPAANGIPSSVFFPQTDPEDRLSQCSASLQALLGLSPTSLHALSKLVNNPEIADDIIAVIKAVVAQFPAKGSANELESGSVEIPLSVRLWRVSGCHELLASLGFDLMEVGQDQVTLRTGKQANRRNCQFVLQALLALFDTHEAPKSLGLDSCSSSESLNEDSMSETANGASSITTIATAPAHLVPQQRSVSPVPTASGSSSATAAATLNLSLSRPPLPFRRAPILSSSGGAFTSYVRRRGEPDGGRTDVDANGGGVGAALNVIGGAAAPMMDSSQTNTTDSELSDGYTSQTLNKFEAKPKMGFSSLRAPVKVGRPGGGGESDAAFTPSPPVTVMDSNVSMALAHQTRIRNLYSASNGGQQTGPQSGKGGEHHGLTANGGAGPAGGIARRPDSSSSASSTTDWEGSGHATVLRRANQQQHHHHQQQHQQQHQAALLQVLPPLPPPRQTMPLVDSLRPLAPLAPVYNNLGLKQVVQVQQLQPHAVKMSASVAVLESTSSDSDFERCMNGFEQQQAASAGHQQPQHQQQSIGHANKDGTTTAATNTEPTTAVPSSYGHMLRGRMKMKQPLQQFLTRNGDHHQMEFIDRSFGTTAGSNGRAQRIAATAGNKSAHSMPTATANAMHSDANNEPSSSNIHPDSTLKITANNLYFSPADNDTLESNKKDLLHSIKLNKDHHHQQPQSQQPQQRSHHSHPHPKISAAHSKTVQDSIMRHMNREMTPTISEVYHERSLGLGLAPPLSKLLLSKNYDESEAMHLGGIGNSNGGNSNKNDHTMTGSANMSNLSAMLKESSANDLDISNAIPMVTTTATNASSSSSAAAAATNVVPNNNAASSAPALTKEGACKVCNGPAGQMCGCRTGTTKKKSSSSTIGSKPWLSNVLPGLMKNNINNDLNTAEMLAERQQLKGAKNVASKKSSANNVSSSSVAVGVVHNKRNANSPQFSDLSRRDDGDGRSVADSQCSGNYSKVDVTGNVAAQKQQQQLLRSKFSAMKLSTDDNNKA